MLFLPFFTPKALFLAAFQDLQRAHSSNICRLSTGSQGLVASNQHKVRACFLTFLAPDSETLQERMDDGCSQNNFALSDSAHLTFKHLRLCFVWHWHLLERLSATLPMSFSSSDCLCSLYRTYYENEVAGSRPCTSKCGCRAFYRRREHRDTLLRCLGGMASPNACKACSGTGHGRRIRSCSLCCRQWPYHSGLPALPKHSPLSSSLPMAEHEKLHCMYEGMKRVLPVCLSPS